MKSISKKFTHNHLTIINQGRAFRKIDLNSVDWTQSEIRQKDVAVTYRLAGPGGEEVTTKMADGHIEAEKVKVEEGSVIIRNPGGEEYPYGGKTEEKFLAKHKKQDDGKFMPIDQPRLLLTVDEDICFPHPWGEGKNFYLKAGGVLVFAGYKEDGSPDIYGIQADEARLTYGEPQGLSEEVEDKLQIPRDFDRSAFVSNEVLRSLTPEPV